MGNQTWTDILSLCDEVERLLGAAAPVADPARLPDNGGV